MSFSNIFIQAQNSKAEINSMGVLHKNPKQSHLQQVQNLI